MKKAASACLLLLASLLVIVASPLSVSTNKSSYSPGETVTITINGKPSTPYGVEVKDPDGGLLAVTQATTDASGVATVSVGIPSQAKLGTYTVYVAGGGEAATTTFIVAAAPSPAPTPVTVAPSAAAAAALSSARTRFSLLLKVVKGLRSSLGLLGLESVLANVTAAVEGLNATLREADAKLAAGDYSGASTLASRASADAGSLIEQAFSLAVGALEGYGDRLGNATSDDLALSLVNITRVLLADVSPRYVDASLERVDFSARILLAAGRLVNASQLESRVADLSKSLEEAQSMLRAAQERVRELEGTVASLKTSSEQLQAQLADAQSALASSRSELERLRAENEQLRARSGELEEQMSRLSSQANMLPFVGAVIGLAIGFAVGYLIKRKKQ